MSPVAIIQGTPTWVGLLLVFLAYRGFTALQGSTSPLSKLAIVPVIFAGMGIAHLVSEPLAGWTAASAWIVGLCGGIAGGVFTANRTRFIVDPVARTVMLPGSVVPLLLIALTFVAKFWLGFQMATETNAALLTTYVLIDAAVSGAVAGMFAGRFVTYWRTMTACSGLLDVGDVSSASSGNTHAS
ncbi:DUF6622 family protein [Caballeronia ptereochthonis]|uniref:Uncharacterized protein n=1 Tax=Caballeronia ptereochthonis TaxID=1777144 RepID=A0A158BBI4_9BURK|nr:DUF6622 family protein [Caballeronia ptereochthonis]SAK67444.1 hypothetical protein AWB83_03092 [Caballeronia ptereochthonis]